MSITHHDDHALNPSAENWRHHLRAGASMTEGTRDRHRSVPRSRAAVDTYPVIPLFAARRSSGVREGSYCLSARAAAVICAASATLTNLLSELALVQGLPRGWAQAFRIGAVVACSARPGSDRCSGEVVALRHYADKRRGADALPTEPYRSTLRCATPHVADIRKASLVLE